MTEWDNSCENSSEAKTVQKVDTVESTSPQASHFSTCLASEMSTVFIPDYLFKDSLEDRDGVASGTKCRHTSL